MLLMSLSTIIPPRVCPQPHLPPDQDMQIEDGWMDSAL